MPREAVTETDAELFNVADCELICVREAVTLADRVSDCVASRDGVCSEGEMVTIAEPDRVMAINCEPVNVVVGLDSSD